MYNYELSVVLVSGGDAIKKDLMEWCDQVQDRKYMKTIPSETWKVTERFFKKLTAKHWGDHIAVEKLCRASSLSEVAFFKEGHYVSRSGDSNRSLTRYNVGVSGVTEEEMEDIYLRLRVYDFGGNFGVHEADRLSKIISYDDTARIKRGVFTIDAMGSKYLDKTLYRLLKKYPKAKFVLSQCSFKDDSVCVTETKEYVTREKMIVTFEEWIERNNYARVFASC